MIIDVIILSYAKNHEIKQMTDNAIRTLLHSEESGKYNFNVIVVETNPDESINYGNCHTIHPNLKFNYNKFLNIGMQKCQSDSYVIIANNDLIFHEDWLTSILYEMNLNKYDSACPMNPGWAWHVGYENTNVEGFDIGRHLCGWCIVFRKQTIDKIAPFDEDLEFWFQDNMIAHDLQSNGFKHALVGSSKVTHLISKSHNLLSSSEHERMTVGMQEVFERKMREKNG